VGRKIAIVGAGAVGGYAGAHMVQAGEDVTFIDPWPAHVEQMRKHGLRVTHAMDVPEFCVAVRSLHVTGRAAARQGETGRHRLRVHEVVRHGVGDDADPAISGARRLHY
jgi:2-polyprenyl-6-methoxyphenol hydroxylase-like FAD-dependent oxidoreductase